MANPNSGPKMTLKFNDASVRLMLDNLEKFGTEGAKRTMQRLLTLGNSHLTRLLNALIYATPTRSNYERTRKLRAGARVRLRRVGKNEALYVVSYAPYSPYVEYGTYAGKVSPDNVLEESRRLAEAGNDLIILEYGRPQMGMEARPFAYPTVAYLEHKLPEEAKKVLREML